MTKTEIETYAKGLSIQLEWHPSCLTAYYSDSEGYLTHQKLVLWEDTEEIIFWLDGLATVAA